MDALTTIQVNEFRLYDFNGTLIAFILVRRGHITFCVGNWHKSIGVDTSHDIIEGISQECKKRLAALK